MKRYITYAVALLFAASAISFAATPDKDAMMAKEKEAWQAYKDKKTDDFKKFLDKGYRGVYADGIIDQKGELDGMKESDMKSFALSDFEFYSDEPDVIVTTYKVAIQGTADGKDISGTYNCGSVWKSENGVWLVIFHTNVKAETAKK